MLRVAGSSEVSRAVPAVLGLMHMLRERRPMHAAVGGALAFAGLACWLCQMGVAFMLWQMGISE